MKQSNSSVQKDSKRDSLIRSIIELIEEDPSLTVGAENEIIYQIEDITIYGGFEGGYRAVDHNVLKFDGIEWEDILQQGIVVVPETEVYISNTAVERFERIGYSRQPLECNHIVGQ